LTSLAHRNQRLGLKRLSLHADMLKERSKGVGIEFRYIMQADFVLYLRGQLEDFYWWPETLLWVGRYSGAFEVFARCKSRAYFERVKVILNVASLSDLQQLIQKITEEKRHLPRWEINSINPKNLLGLDEMAVRN